MAFLFSFVLFCFLCFCFCTASILTFVQRKLRADVALLDYVRHWRSYISGRQSPVLALFLLLTLLLFTFELRHKEPLQRRPRNNERDSKLQL